MKLDYDNTRTRNSLTLKIEEDIKNKSPLEIFSDFYKQQNGTALTSEQEKILQDIIMMKQLEI